MPVKSADADPHYLWCILLKLKHCLSEDSPYAVSCHRDDCWSDIDLNKWSCAVNLSFQRENYNERRSSSTGPGKNSACAYIASLSFKVEIYSIGCDEQSIRDAFVSMADVQQRICSCDGFRELEPLNSDFEVTQEGEQELTRIDLFYELEYTHNPCDPARSNCREK